MVEVVAAWGVAPEAAGKLVAGAAVRISEAGGVASAAAIPELLFGTVEPVCTEL
jgi:hypothetical protein